MNLGNGNDTITGSGGADVMYGGRGNDTFVINADNAGRITTAAVSQATMSFDGGTGLDSIELSGTGIDFDLRNVKSDRLQDVERIDITGNNVTVDKVLRREMILVEGDAFNTANETAHRDIGEKVAEMHGWMLQDRGGKR